MIKSCFYGLVFSVIYIYPYTHTYTHIHSCFPKLRLISSMWEDLLRLYKCSTPSCNPLSHTQRHNHRFCFFLMFLPTQTPTQKILPYSIDTLLTHNTNAATQCVFLHRKPFLMLACLGFSHGFFFFCHKVQSKHTNVIQDFHVQPVSLPQAEKSAG